MYYVRLWMELKIMCSKLTLKGYANKYQSINKWYGWLVISRLKSKNFNRHCINFQYKPKAYLQLVKVEYTLYLVAKKDEVIGFYSLWLLLMLLSLPPSSVFFCYIDKMYCALSPSLHVMILRGCVWLCVPNNGIYCHLNGNGVDKKKRNVVDWVFDWGKMCMCVAMIATDTLEFISSWKQYTANIPNSHFRTNRLCNISCVPLFIWKVSSHFSLLSIANDMLFGCCPNS